MEASHQRQVAELNKRLQDSEQNVVEMTEQEGRHAHILQQARKENAVKLVIPTPFTQPLPCLISWLKQFPRGG
jgi:hypothetical protein